MIRPIWATLASVALLLAGAAQAADSAAFPGLPATKAPERVKSGELLDRAVAVVNDGIVTESDLQEQMAMITERLAEQKTPQPPPDVLRKQVLDRLVIQEIQLQRAEKVGLKITDEQLNEQLADIAKRNNITLAQLPAALAQQGIEYAGFRDNMRKEMTLQRLRQRDVLSKINVTPRELEQFLERMKKLPSETDEYNVSHILLAVPPEATQAQVKEVEKLAEDVYNRSKNEDFGRLAVAYSNSQTALEGGALGWRKGPELPTVLAEIVVGLKPGQVSRPMFTNTGYHLVKLNGIRSTEGSHIEDQVHARHILMRPNELQDDATVRQRLVDIRERVLKGEDFAAFASTMSVDSSSAVNGGDLGWSGPGSFVPEFDATLARLKENEISEPFHTEFGWHIVQLLESKADEETEMWLRRLRDEAFVETDL